MHTNFYRLVWYDWSMVLNREFVILAVGYMVLLRLSEFSLVACGRKIGLGVELFWLMDVINYDGPVTIILGRNVGHGTVATTGYSVEM